MGYYVCHEKDLCKKAACGTPTCNSSARETRWWETLSQKNKVTAISAILQRTEQAHAPGVVSQHRLDSMVLFACFLSF